VTTLAKLDRARQALAEAKTLEDIVSIRDIAVAAASFAKAAKLSGEAYAEALEIKRDAERRAGQKLGELEKTKGRPADSRTDNPVGSSYAKTLDAENIHERQAQRWQKLAELSDEDFAANQAAMRERITRAAETGSSVTYKHQPGIDASKGNVPLAGTSHLYTVSKLLWPSDVEDVLQGLLLGRSLHACCGVSKLGDVRLDLDATHQPDIEADAADMPVADDEYDTVLCDPPYNGDHDWNHRLLAELSRVAAKRIVFQHWFIPASPDGRYRKAQEKFALSEIYVWQPKTYFGRAQLVSVFDHV
jgi:hypothetical protein